ncbi:hypothetical protein PM082_011318 [Marasmius tenuissimus]|nr:hypothetical protein PM082_011318 [Marasmius tenuissimus]
MSVDCCKASHTIKEGYSTSAAVVSLSKILHREAQVRDSAQQSKTSNRQAAKRPPKADTSFWLEAPLFF